MEQATLEQLRKAMAKLEAAPQAIQFKNAYDMDCLTVAIREKLKEVQITHAHKLTLKPYNNKIPILKTRGCQAVYDYLVKNGYADIINEMRFRTEILVDDSMASLFDDIDPIAYLKYCES